MNGRWLDLVLPGVRDLGTRPVRAIVLLAAWVALWALVVVRRGRVLSVVTSSNIEGWIALATLVGALWLIVRAASGRPSGRAGAEGAGLERVGPQHAGQWALGWRTFRRHRPAMFGLALVGGLGLVALLTPFLAPFDPAAQGADIVATRFHPPSWEHLMGTDRFGRDVLSRVLYGGRVSLAIGTLAILIAITIGSMIGAIAGYTRGWVDAISMRTVDLLLSFPRLVLLITIVALVEPSVLVITLVLGLTGWMGTSRLVRGEVLSLREREFVQAARALGFGTPRIIFRHILPNVASPIIVAATLGIGNTILVEASLSFLGLGVPPPAPSWGLMVAAGKDVMLDAPWVALFPGLAIVLTVMSFNLVGDGLRDALDPKSTTGILS
ncbi:MAG: ABC transporter permease [Gemmatimonadota bacterium]